MPISRRMQHEVAPEYLMGGAGALRGGDFVPTIVTRTANSWTPAWCDVRQLHK